MSDIFESFIENNLYGDMVDLLPKDSSCHMLNLRAVADETYKTDIYGIYEIENYTASELIEVLAQRLKKMGEDFGSCCKGTALEEDLEVSRLVDDMWLFSFGDLIDYSLLEDKYREKLLQFLLDRFEIEADAGEHYKEIKDNDNYRRYMTGLFSIGDNAGGFWHMLATIGSSDEGKNDLAMGFLTDYIRFMVQLEVYLDTVLPDFGFVNNMRYHVMTIVSTIADNMEANMAAAPLIKGDENSGEDSCGCGCDHDHDHEHSCNCDHDHDHDHCDCAHDHQCGCDHDHECDCDHHKG